MKQNEKESRQAQAADTRGVPSVKRTLKDSVFGDLFRDKRYLLQMYQALHPEDTETTEEDLRDITIHNAFLNGIRNDLGFQAGNRTIILTEAQSTWTENIVIRGLDYIATTYQRIIRETGQNIYGSKKVQLPKPELYVIYTGEQRKGGKYPEYISFAESFFGGEEICLDIKAKILYGTEKGDDIVSQYVTFAKTYDTNRKRYPEDPWRAVWETIWECKASNVLKEYLQSREQEVTKFMWAEMTTEEIYEMNLECEKREARKIALQEGQKEAHRKDAIRLYQKGKDVEFIADMLDESVRQVEEWVGLVIA